MKRIAFHATSMTGINAKLITHLPCIE